MLSLQDRYEIEELINRFAHYSDYEDYESLAQLYTPDIVTNITGIDHPFKGIEAQIQHARESARFTNGKNRHFYTNLFIEELDGNHFANYYVINVNAGDQPMAPRMVVTGRMRDRVVKSASGWRIAERRFTPDQPFQIPAEERRA